MVIEIQLSDYGVDFEAFCNACYEEYLSFWQGNPTFQGKVIQRNTTKISRDKEDDFWGMVDGHNDNKQNTGYERYSKVPLLSYVLDPQNVAASSDVLFIRKLHKRKIRIEVFSISKGYVVVLQEIGKTGRIQFITAHPLTSYQVEKKKKQYEEFKKNGFEPI